MLNIYLVRHGQNEDNQNGILNGHRDLPLTKIGVEQAKNLALHLEKLGIGFDKVYSSPLSRALSPQKSSPTISVSPNQKRFPISSNEISAS